MSLTTEDREGFAAFLLRMRGAGFDDKQLIAAIEATPRRAFAPGQFHDAIWGRRMIPIDCGETMEGLDIQARVLSALGVERGHRVLEVGAGSGFTAAVMGRVAQKVLTTERYRRLVDQARQRIEALQLNNVIVRHVDASNGIPAEAPFDRIVVWAAFESLPRTFVDQLSTNGVMVAPIGPAEGEQVVARLTKVGSRFDREDIAVVRLQPIAQGVASFI